MRRCCPKCGSKGFKSRQVLRYRRGPRGTMIPYGKPVALYTCKCGWEGLWTEMAKRKSRKSEKRAKQLKRLFG